MQKIPILVIRNAYQYDFGGGERFPVELASELLLYGYEPIIVSRSSKLRNYAESKNLHNIVKGWWWSRQNWGGRRAFLLPFYLTWQLLLFFWYVFMVVRTGAKIVHIQSRDDFVAATIAAKLLRKKIIWTDHADLKYIYANHKIWYKNPIGKLVYIAGFLADRVTIASNSEKQLIEESLGKGLPDNYTVIYLGVTDSYKPIKRDDKNLVLVATSRLVKAKGIGELIEAFKLIDVKNAVLKLCGDGPDSTYFKSLALGTKNIEFLGHTKDVTHVLQVSDIFIHPTHHEGFGLSLVEAEMCSLPVIASNVDSIPEIVENGKSGILVQAKNIDELAAAITTLANNPRLRTTMGQAGRQIYLQKFQFDEIVKSKFLPLYEKN